MPDRVPRSSSAQLRSIKGTERLRDISQRDSKENPIDETANALILCCRVKFSKCIAGADRAERGF
jgi:hypothetical protein